MSVEDKVSDNTAPALRPYGSTFGRSHSTDGYSRPESITVDCHGHMSVPAADDLVRPHLPASQLDAVRYASEASRAVNVQQGKERKDEMTGVEQRLADMDRMGIDVMVISPVPPQLNYQAEPSLGHEASQLINNHLAQSAKENERLIALGTVPLQDCDLAVSELERCINELGMPGVEIGANAGADELSAERLEAFWAKAEELETTILLHPTSYASDRLSAHYLTNIVGNPLETTVAVHHMIFDGVLERYPNLRIVLAHGGAYAGAYAARMDHAWGARSDCRGSINRPPTTYLEKFYFDSIVFSTDQLEYLASRFGTDKILMGTDYPFDMAEYDPVEHIMSCSDFSPSQISAMCGITAAELFNIDVKLAGCAKFNGGTA